MANAIESIRQLLHEASETHHQVFRITDGTDDDWASWYADWLTKLSEFPNLVDNKPVRSEVVYLLVKLDKDYNATMPAEPWEAFYASRLIEHFSSGAPATPGAR